MSADFNAGSIEGSLTLDTSPFRTGLERAQEQAKRFESNDITPTLGLDRKDFDAKKAETDLALDVLGRRKVEPKVGLDISEALTKATLLQAVLARSFKKGGQVGGGIASAGFGIAKLALMPALYASIAAAAAPATAAIVGFGAAGAVAFGGLIPVVGLFGKAVGSAVGQITKAVKAGQQLPGVAGQAETAFKKMSGQWSALQKNAGVFPLLTKVFNGAAAILPMLSPLVKTFSDGLSHSLDVLGTLGHTQILGQFLKSLQGLVRGVSNGLGPVLKNLLVGFMHLFVALQPLFGMLGRGILMLSQKFEQFGKSLDANGVSKFISYMKADLPVLGRLVSNLFSGIVNLGKGLAPLATPALHFINSLVAAIGHLDIAPLAAGLGAVLTAARPLLGVISSLLNVALKPLGNLLRDLSQGTLVPLAASLKSNLRPAFKALGDILNTLEKPVAAFLASIANLVNPTGVGLLSALLQGLDKAIKPLVKPVTDLVLALEAVVDDGISAVTPAIGPLSKALGGVARVLAPVIEGLAKFIALKPVALTILAVAGAMKAVKLASAGWAAVTGAIKAVKDMAILTRIQLGLLWLSEKAGAASTAVISAVTTALSALKNMAIGTRLELAALWVVEKVGAAVSAIMTAAQWALDAALDANPISLIVIAIAALVAGLIYAYTHSKTFKKIVNESFQAVAHVAKVVFDWLKNAVMTIVDFIKGHWKLLLAILTGPIGAAVIFIVSHFTQIKNFIGSVIGAVKDTVSNGISDVVGFFEALPGRILALGSQMVNAGKSLMSSIFHGLESAATSVGGFAANIATSIWNALKGVLNSVLPHSIGIHKFGINATIPLFPYLAKGGITSGMTPAVIGDNPGGREAVIPLDKYDLPRKGDSARQAAAHRAEAQKHNDALLAELKRANQNASEQLAALRDIVSGLLGLGKMSDEQIRKMVQIARAT